MYKRQVLIIIVAIFLLMKMFTGNPLEGSWTDEDGNMNLKMCIRDRIRGVSYDQYINTWNY